MYDVHRRTADVPAPAFHTLEASAPQPTLRIRVEHSRTIKDGWGYSTTVELDGIDTNDTPYNNAINILDAALLETRLLGERERNERNQRDNAAKEATAPIASTAGGVPPGPETHS